MERRDSALFKLIGLRLRAVVGRNRSAMHA